MSTEAVDLPDQPGLLRTDLPKTFLKTTDLTMVALAADRLPDPVGARLIGEDVVDFAVDHRRDL